MKFVRAARLLKEVFGGEPSARPSTGIATVRFDDARAHLRDSDSEGCAEIVIGCADGSHSIISLSRHQVRAWNAKLANIIAREH